MSKIEKYNKHLYPSYKDALCELVAQHQTRHDAVMGNIYTKEAYEEVAAFLCMNNIQHTFTVYPNCSRIDARIIAVTFRSGRGEQSLTWWEKTEEE